MEPQTLEDPRVNAFEPYTDTEGITHVTIFDDGKDFELIDGEWVEKAPF